MDHVAEGIARLPTCFRETTVEDVVEALAGAQQSVEDALDAMPTAMSIDGAVGVQLDGIGDVVGEPRNGETDDEKYRLRLKARVRINRSAGRPEDVYAVLGLVIDTGVALRLREEYPAAFSVLATGVGVTNPDLLTGFIGEVKGAGIGARLVAANATAANTFTLDGVAGQGLDQGVLTDIWSA
jgi:hypothetical protein